MENRTEKITVATFFNHYGAMKMKKALGPDAVLRPVPRLLSSSCGTCVFINRKEDALKDILDNADENLEAVYTKDGEKYTNIWKVN